MLKKMQPGFVKHHIYEWTVISCSPEFDACFLVVTPLLRLINHLTFAISCNSNWDPCCKGTPLSPLLSKPWAFRPPRLLNKMKLLFNLFWGATIFRWAYASSDESFTICLRFKIDHFPNQGSENHEVVTLENRDEWCPPILRQMFGLDELQFGMATCSEGCVICILKGPLALQLQYSTTACGTLRKYYQNLKNKLLSQTEVWGKKIIEI